MKKIIYEILESGIHSQKDLEKKTGLKNRKIRLAIAELREDFYKGNVDKYVCICQVGYYLSDKLVDASFSFCEKRKKALKMLEDVRKHEKAFLDREKEKLF